MGHRIRHINVLTDGTVVHDSRLVLRIIGHGIGVPKLIIRWIHRLPGVSVIVTGVNRPTVLDSGEVLSIGRHGNRIPL